MDSARSRSPAAAGLILGAFIFTLGAAPAQKKKHTTAPAPKGAPPVSPSTYAGEFIAKNLQCAENLTPLFWNTYAKNPHLSPAEMFAAFRAQMQREYNDDNSLLQGNHQAVATNYARHLSELLAQVRALRADLTQQASRIDAYDADPNRNDAGYRQIARELGALYAKTYAQTSELSLWSRAQARDEAEAYNDIYALSPTDPSGPLDGKKLFESAAPIPGLNYDEQVQRIYPRLAADKVPLGFTVEQARYYRRSLLDLQNSEFPKIEERLADLVRIYQSTAQGVPDSEKLPQPFARAAAMAPVLPAGGATYEGLREYLQAMEKYLKDKKLLPACKRTLSLEPQAQTRQHEMQKAPPPEPWHAQVRDTPLGESFFNANKLYCEEDLATHLRNWSSEVLRSSKSAEDITRELRQAQRQRTDPNGASPLAQHAHLQKLREEAASMLGQFQKTFQLYKANRNPATTEKMKALLGPLEAQSRLLPQDRFRLERFLREFYPGQQSPALSGFAAELNAHPRPGLLDFDRSPTDPEVNQRSNALIAKLQSYEKVLAEETASLRVRDRTRANAAKINISPLYEWTLRLERIRESKSWSKLNGKSLEEEIHALAQQLAPSLREGGLIEPCGAPALVASADSEHDRRSERLGQHRQALKKLIEDAIVADPSCHQVISGNKGAETVGDIKNMPMVVRVPGADGESIDRRTNVGAEYPRFAAKSFLQTLCVDWDKKARMAVQAPYFEKLPQWKKVHPYHRATLASEKSAAIPDALSLKVNRELPSHVNPAGFAKLSAQFAQPGSHNLPLNAAFVYAAIVKESSVRNLVTIEEQNQYYNLHDKKSGLGHGSATSLGTRADFLNVSAIAQHPFAMQLLSDYVKKLRELVRDPSPAGQKRFRDFCGVTHFEEEYGKRPLQNTISTVINTKSDGKTCDQTIDSGAKDYLQGNIISCYRTVATFCPSYGFNQTMLSARGVRSHHGTMFRNQGVKPACLKLFTDLHQAVAAERTKGENNLCSTIETID